MAMGGRVAEELFFGNEQITTGCGSDLNNATSNAYGLIYNYGMSGLRTIMDPRAASNKMRGQVDHSVQEILNVN